MPRNRVYFNELNLFVGPTPCTGQHFSLGNTGTNLVNELTRIQSVSINGALNPIDINEFGHADRVDSIFLTAPTVNLTFSYFPLDGSNEKILGFSTNSLNSSFLSGIMAGTTDQKNYFLAISPQGVDDDYDTDQVNRNVISIGNGFITNYTLSAATNQVPTVTVTVDALNIKFDTGTRDLGIPAVNPINGQAIASWNFTVPTGSAYTGQQGADFPNLSVPAALRPGEISLEFPQTGAMGIFLSGQSSVNIQGFNLSIPVTRSDIDRIGTLFDVTKTLNLPITSTLSINALLTDLRADSLSNVLCNYQNNNFTIRMRQPSCTGNGADAILIQFKNAKLISEDFGFGIGSNATTTATFTAQISASNSSNSGPFFSGLNG